MRINLLFGGNKLPLSLSLALSASFTSDARSFHFESVRIVEPFQHLSSSLTVQNSFNSLVSPFVFLFAAFRQTQAHDRKKWNNDGKMKTNVIHTPFWRTQSDFI